MAVAPAAAGSLGGDLLKKALDLLFDPAFYEALSPSAGLTVTPLLFNSVEQEGRWKVKDWGFSAEVFSGEERQLTNRILKAKKEEKIDPIPNPGDAPVRYRVAISGQPATTSSSGKLLTIHIPKPDTSGPIFETLSSLTAPLGKPLSDLLEETILQEGHAEISAHWFYDELEIWGGFAGLTAAKGFGSVFGHRANVQLTGTVYGNYLPASFLIGMSGYVNPVGPNYKEFRCGAVVQAGKDKRIQPLYGEQWDRDGKTTPLLFQPKVGFDLAVGLL